MLISAPEPLHSLFLLPGTLFPSVLGKFQALSVLFPVSIQWSHLLKNKTKQNKPQKNKKQKTKENKKKKKKKKKEKKNRHMNKPNSQKKQKIEFDM